MKKSYMFPAIIVTAVVAVALLAYALLLPVTEDEVVIETTTAESIIEAPEESQQAVVTAANETDASSKPTSLAELPELIVDIARVQPDGMAVFAGKGAAGGTIFITENGEILAQNAIDQQGQWVVLPDKPLSPGAHLLELQMVTKDGLTVRADISLVVEISEGLDEKPLVAVVPQTDEASPVLLQAPEEGAPTIVAESTKETDSKATQTAKTATTATDDEVKTVAEILGQEDIFIQIGSLSWQSDTRLAIHGVASGGDVVDGLIGDMKLAKVAVPQSNRWSIIVDGDPFAVSDSQLIKVNLRGENDDILASTELMMNKNQLKAGLDGSLMVVVHKGDALWRIAYRSYGQGVRYVDIFKRNADKINDPDLIYPNQIFAVPGVVSQTNDN